MSQIPRRKSNHPSQALEEPVTGRRLALFGSGFGKVCVCESSLIFSKDPDPWSVLFAGFLCLRAHNILAFATGITILGVCHYTLTVKGSHLATHSALTESKRWSKILMIFFLEVSLAGWGSCWATLCAHSHGQGAAAEGG